MKSCSRECRASSPPPSPLARSFLGFSPRRSIHSVTSIALQRPWRTRGGDLHCKALPAERILPVATPYQSREGGEGCTKGSKGKKGSLALDQLPYPSCSHLLSTCVVRMRLLAVETRPPYYHPAFSRHFIFHSPPPISRQTIHDYALRKSSRLLRTTTRPFSFSISSRGILVRVVSNETKFEETDSLNFRLKFFISRLSKSCSFSSHEFRRSFESRRNFSPLRISKPRRKHATSKLQNSLLSFIRGLLVHACSGEFVYTVQVPDPSMKTLSLFIFFPFRLYARFSSTLLTGGMRFMPHTFRKTIPCSARILQNGQ